MAKRCEHCRHWKPQGAPIGTNPQGWPVRAGACGVDGSRTHYDETGATAARHSLNYACDEYRPAQAVGFEKHRGAGRAMELSRKWGA